MRSDVEVELVGYDCGEQSKTCFVIGKPSLCIRTVSIDLLYVEEKDESVLL